MSGGTTTRAQALGVAAEQRWALQLRDHPNALAVSTDGLVAVGSLAGEALLADPADGAILAALPEHDFGVLSAAWRPDGERVAVGGADGRVALYDRSGRLVAEQAIGGWVGALAWSPDGTHLAAGAGREVWVLAGDGEVVRHYPDQPSTVTDLAWAGSRQRLGVACYGGVRWFEPADRGRDPMKVFDWKGSLLVLEVSPNQRWAASGNQDSSIHVWRLWSGDDLEMTGYPSKVGALAWDVSSRWLAASGSEAVTVWDHSGRGPQGRRPLMLEAHDKLVAALAYQQRGALLASGGRDGLVAVWRPGKGRNRPVALLRDGSPVSHLGWSTDDRDLVVARADGTVSSWRVGDP